MYPQSYDFEQKTLYKENGWGSRKDTNIAIYNIHSYLCIHILQNYFIFYVAPKWRQLMPTNNQVFWSPVSRLWYDYFCLVVTSHPQKIFIQLYCCCCCWWWCCWLLLDALMCVYMLWEIYIYGIYIYYIYHIYIDRLI